MPDSQLSKLKAQLRLCAPRTILHVDMDAFFAAIEQRDNPEFKGKPVVVGGPPHDRGVVSTCSYEARKFGIHSAMPSREAYRRCPHAIFVPGNHRHYMDVSHQIFQIFERYTPWVEGLSCDEAFLDVTGARNLFGDGETIAQRIRADISNELQLTASVGVAPNKFLAKIGSDMQKPDGLTRIPFEQDAITEFLAPLPISKIFGIGKRTAEILENAYIRKIGDLQRASVQTLTRLLGENAAHRLHILAFGLDNRSVETEREEKSISREHTFHVDESNPEAVRTILIELAAHVGHSLRKANKFANTCRIKIRWSDFTTFTRQQGFEVPACDDITLRESALELLEREQLNGNSVRLIGFGVSGLIDERIAQPSLFDAFEPKPHEKRERISAVLDTLRATTDANLQWGTLHKPIQGRDDD